MAGLRTAAASQRGQYEIMLGVVLIQLEAAGTDPKIARSNSRVLGHCERSPGAHRPGGVDDALAREDRAG